MNDHEKLILKAHIGEEIDIVVYWRHKDKWSEVSMNELQLTIEHSIFIWSNGCCILILRSSESPDIEGCCEPGKFIMDSIDESSFVWLTLSCSSSHFHFAFGNFDWCVGVTAKGKNQMLDEAKSSQSTSFYWMNFHSSRTSPFSLYWWKSSSMAINF